MKIAMQLGGVYSITGEKERGRWLPSLGKTVQVFFGEWEKQFQIMKDLGY